MTSVTIEIPQIIDETTQLIAADLSKNEGREVTQEEVINMLLNKGLETVVLDKMSH